MYSYLTDTKLLNGSVLFSHFIFDIIFSKYINKSDKKKSIMSLTLRQSSSILKHKFTKQLPCHCTSMPKRASYSLNPHNLLNLNTGCKDFNLSHFSSTISLYVLMLFLRQADPPSVVISFSIIFLSSSFLIRS